MPRFLLGVITGVVSSAVVTGLAYVHYCPKGKQYIQHYGPDCPVLLGKRIHFWRPSKTAEIVN